MISIISYRHENALCGFHCSGHAGFADEGQDIVCASVTSAVQLTFNGITEVLGLPAEVQVQENEIEFRLSVQSETAVAFLEALLLQLQVLSEDFPNTIQITNLEV